MELNGHDVKGAGEWKTLGKEGNCIVARNKDGIGSALEAGPDVCAQVVDRADEVLILGDKMSDGNTPENGKEPGT